MADLDRAIAVSTLRWWRELAELNPQDLVPRIDAMLKQAPPAAVFKSTAKRVAALQARDAAQAPPAAAVSARDESPVYVCEGLTVPAWAIHYANELGAYFKASGTGFWAIGPVQSRYGEAPPAAAVSAEAMLAALDDACKNSQGRRVSWYGYTEDHRIDVMRRAMLAAAQGVKP